MRSSTVKMSQSDNASFDDDSDDDDWQFMENVIKERKSENGHVMKGALLSKSVEEVLNIDDFFEMGDAKDDDLTNCTFQMQRVIENSLRNTVSNSFQASTESSSSSSSSQASSLADTDISRESHVTPHKWALLPSSSSSSRHTKESPIMRYHTSPDNFNNMKLVSDEILIHVLSFADYTTQRVCQQWSTIQIKVSRLKIVDTLKNISLLNQEIAGQIESELFQLYSEKLSNEYRQRARSLIFNLRGNEELRMRVINRSLLASNLVRMESTETATKHLVQQREGTGFVNSYTLSIWCCLNKTYHCL